MIKREMSGQKGCLEQEIRRCHISLLHFPSDSASGNFTANCEGSHSPPAVASAPMFPIRCFLWTYTGYHLTNVVVVSTEIRRQNRWTSGSRANESVIHKSSSVSQRTVGSSGQLPSAALAVPRTDQSYPRTALTQMFGELNKTAENDVSR